MNQNKKVIAITGGIGSGKSTVIQFLKDWGYQVLSADEISKEVATLPEILEKIKNEFGQEFVTENGLNRQALREYVFGSEERTKKLNSIFHNTIAEVLKDRVSKMDGTVFVEVTVADALPNGFANEVWEVTADSETRIKRVMFRDNVRADNVRDIINRQRNHPAPNVVIDNNGYIDELVQKLKVLLEN